MALSIDDVTVSGKDILPLKIHSKGQNKSAEFLKKWIGANKAWLDQKLLEHGLYDILDYEVQYSCLQEAAVETLCETGCHVGVLIDSIRRFSRLTTPSAKGPNVTHQPGLMDKSIVFYNNYRLYFSAILFQGFEVKEAIDFQEAIQQYNPDLCDTYRGTSPRRQIPGTQYVFSASEFPPHYPIPQHLEMAFLPAPPRKLFFCCLEAPTSAGGETCLADYKAVYDTMDPEIRQTFEDKGVMHIRNYVRQRGLFTDPSMMKGWEAVFGTKDREEVERELQADNTEHSWGDDDMLRIVNRVPAVEKHPQSGVKVWFNHLMVFHWTMYYDEPYRVYKRLGSLKQLLYSWVLWAASFFYVGLKPPSPNLKLGMNTAYGDGTAIPYGVVSHVRDTVWKNLVFNRWEQGDVLMIDNFRVSHGRQPFTGKRKIVVSWSNPLTRPSLL